jgi:hypothetical protein
MKELLVVCLSVLSGETDSETRGIVTERGKEVTGVEMLEDGTGWC